MNSNSPHPQNATHKNEVRCADTWVSRRSSQRPIQATTVDTKATVMGRASESAASHRRRLRIGIPRVLNLYSTAPFFRTYLESLSEA